MKRLNLLSLFLSLLMLSAGWAQTTDPTAAMREKRQAELEAQSDSTRPTWIQQTGKIRFAVNPSLGISQKLNDFWTHVFADAQKQFGLTREQADRFVRWEVSSGQHGPDAIRISVRADSASK